MQHEIRLYGPIGGMFGVDPEDFVSSIPKDATEIVVRIHSPGGSVGDGLAIYHSLKDHAARVVTIVDGYAASAASFVMLAGDEVRVHRNSIVMVHNPWTQAAGNSNDLRKVADDLDIHRDAILDIYREKTGYEEEELKEMMDEETYFRGASAVEMGFADTVIDDYEEEQAIAAMLRVENIVAKIQQQEKAMSKQKTRKDIESELEMAVADVSAKIEAIAELEARIASVEAEYTEKIEAIEAAHAEKIAEVEAAKEEIEFAKNEANARIVELQEVVDHLEKEVESRDGAIEILNGQVSETSSQLAAVSMKLENPAFVDASGEGQEPVADGGEGEGGSQTPHIDAYNALTDAVAKTRYWNEHRNEIQNEMKQLSAR